MVELFTVVENTVDAIKVHGGIYIKKREYSIADLKRFLDVAKYYYIEIKNVSDSTDFNDKYHDEWTNYYACNHLNLVIKDNEVYGFVASGLRKKEADYIVLTFARDTLTLFDGSDYSSLKRYFSLMKYNFPVDVLDAAISYKVERKETYYKFIDNKKEYSSERLATYYPLAFDVVVDNDKVTGIKIDDIIFDFDDEKTFEQELMKETVLGVIPYHIYFVYSLIKL